MSKIRSREVVLLVLPVVLLGAVGWYLARRPMPRAEGPLHVAIANLKVTPATPREVYEGYDTKVSMILHHEGTADVPKSWRQVALSTATDNMQLLAVRDGKKRVLVDDKQPNRRVFRHRMSMQVNIPGDTEISALFWVKVSDLPRDIGEVRIIGNLTDMIFFSSGVGRVRRAHRMKLKPTPFEVTVKKASEEIAPPKPSMEQPFELVEKKVTEVDGEYIVSLTVRPTGSAVGWGKKPRIEWSLEGDKDNASFVDVKNQRHFKFKDKVGSWRGMPPNHMGEYGKDGLYRVEYRAPIAQLPKGRLEFHTTISVNDCWPMPVEVVVREK
jgi:hypothetical protein